MPPYGESLDADTIEFLANAECWCVKCGRPVGALRWLAHQEWHERQTPTADEAEAWLRSVR